MIRCEQCVSLAHQCKKLVLLHHLSFHAVCKFCHAGCTVRFEDKRLLFFSVSCDHFRFAQQFVVRRTFLSFSTWFAFLLIPLPAVPIFPLDLSVCLRPLLTERSASRFLIPSAAPPQSRLSLNDSALTQSIEDSSDGAALVNEFHSFVRTRTAWENICSVIMIGCKCKSVCTTAETTTSMRANFFEHVCATR